MTNFYLQKKSIERNKFNKALILSVIILFSAFLLYSFVSCISDMITSSLYMLGNTLYVLPFLIIFFIFFSFECCYKLKGYCEAVSITKKGMNYVYKNQLLSIFSYAFLLFIEALIFNVVYIFANKQFSFALVIHTITVLTIYFLLCIVSSVFIGFLLSKIKQRFISYIIMIVIAISETGLMDSFSVGVYNSFGKDITKLLKFFNIAPNSIGWTPNMHSGYIIALDKLSQMLFFIFLSLLVYSLTDNSSVQKKLMKGTICFILCIVTTVGYILPYSAPVMDLSASGVSLDKRYYNEKRQISEPADFKVEGYDLEFNFRNNLNASAKIKTDNKFKNEYKFTLYHGYKIDKVTDSNDNELKFTRDGDYLTIYSSSNCEYIKICYYGSCSKYYSNYTSAFLPGNFAFYPVPGFNAMYSTSAYSGFNDLSLSYETDFNVKVDSLSDVQCNLERININEFKGKSDSLTLLSGFISSVKVGEVQVYYPYFNEIYNRNTINEKLESFVSVNPDIKKIFIIPDVNLENIEFAKTFNNYMITASIDDIERIGFISNISADKMGLYDAVDAYLNQPEYFEFLKENSSDEMKSSIMYLEEVLKNDENRKKLNQINQYLIDENDNRNFEEMLFELR